MNERTAVLCALAVGGVAFGALFLLSRRKDALAPRIVGQTFLPEADGLPPRVQIEISPSPELRRMGATNETWEYRVVDAAGRTYLHARNCDDSVRTLLVPTLYARPVASPRLEVWTDKGRAASLPLRPMPGPVVRALNARQDARLRAFHLSAAETAHWSETSLYDWAGIRFVPQVVLRPHEFWEYRLLRTPFQDHPFANVAFAARTWGPNVLRVLDGDDVDAVQVGVSQRIEHEASEWVVVSGLRLTQRDGQTVVVPSRAVVPNTLGLQVRVTPYWSSYDSRTHPGPDGDYRSPAIGLSAVPQMGTLKPTEHYEVTGVEIDGAGLARLNLLGIRVGNASWDARRAVRGPVARAPFSLRLRLTKFWHESTGGFETTIPVEASPRF